MCKFHKDIARAIATNSVSGDFDPGRYAVALLAMAQFRIEQYMPAMHGNDGFVPMSMVTPAAIEAFNASGLARPEQDIQAYNDAHIVALRAAMDLTAKSCDVSLRGLNIADNITKDGYKHCAKMPADPTKNGPFLDEAVVDLFQGYDRPGYASKVLLLLSVAHKPQFEAIRMAAEHFMSQPGVNDILKKMFEGALAHIFQAAQEDLRAGRGFEKTDGCVMCHDSKKKPKP